MREPDDPPTGRAAVLAGARTRRPARVVGLVVAAFVLVEVLLLGAGLLVTRVLDDSPLEEQELAFESTVLAHRTPLLDRVTHLGSVLGATGTIVALTAAGCLLLAWRGHGPRLPVYLALAVAGETGLFLLASAAVDRLRPSIPHLDQAPPTSSFPSGHTAAAVALACGLALGLARTRPRHGFAALIWGLAVAFPLFVLLSRLYRGMHWPSDVVASVVYTLLWLLLLRGILLPPGAAARRPRPPPVRP
jgi:undecaprenyl-diphosphatase